MKRRGIIFILSSPSGGGKTTLLNLVKGKDPSLRDSISYTTRTRRNSEREGVDYHFLDEAAFRRRIDQGLFAEWATVHGHLYGTGKADLAGIIDGGNDAIMDIDVQGARSIKAAFPEAVAVFILPPSLAELESRLRQRGTDGNEAVRERLTAAAREMECLPLYDYLIINRDLARSAAELEAVIAAERLRVSRISPGEVLKSVSAGKAH